MKTIPLTLLVAVFLVFCQAVRAKGKTREEKIEHYKKVLAESSGKDRIKPMILLAEHLCRTDVREAEAYLEDAWDLLQEYPSDQHYYEYYGVRGNVFLANGQYEEGVASMEKSLPYLRKINDPEMLSHMYNNLGAITKWLDKLDAAEVYLDSALAIKTRLGDSAGIALSQNNLANLFQVSARHEEAIKYYYKALDYYDNEQEADTQALATIQINIASCFDALKSYDKALAANFRVLRFLDGTAYKVEQAAAWGNIVSIHLDLAQIDSADHYNQLSRELILSSGDRESIADYHFNQASILGHRSKWGEALGHAKQSSETFSQMGVVPKLASAQLLEAECLWHLGKTSDGLGEAKAAYESVVNTGYDGIKLRALKLLYELQKRLGNTGQALAYFEEYSRLDNEIYTTEKNKAIEEIEAKYNVEKAQMLADQREQQVKQEQEKNAILARQNEFQVTRNYLLVIVIILLLVVIMLAATVQRARARSFINEKKMIEAKRDMAEMELKNEKLQQEHLKARVQNQYRSLQDMANHIIEKNELIRQMREAVKKIKTQTEKDSVKEKLIELEMKIKNNLNIEKDHSQLNKKINELNYSFAEELKALHPELTDKEVRLAALLRLDLSSKDVAALFDISPKSVDQSRYRLRKKLNLASDGNLGEYLHSL